MSNEFRLGDYVRDSLTGFEGVVSGKVEYISGCHQCLVTPPVNDAGDARESLWIDTVRLERDGDSSYELPTGRSDDIGPGRKPARVSAPIR